MASAIRNTINLLRRCQQDRAAGMSVSYTTDSHWLVDMAINRRAGWLDDPGCCRGSCQPVNGKYPKRAIGEGLAHLWLLARRINTPRLVVRLNECGEWRELLLRRVPGRLTLGSLKEIG